MVNNQINKTQRIVPKDQAVVSTCTLRTFSTCRSVCSYGFNKSTCYCCFYGNIPSHFPSWDVLTVPWRHLQSGLSGNKGSTTQIVWFVHLCSLGHGKDSMKKRKLYFKMSKKQIGSFFIDLYLSLSSKSQKCESKVLMLCYSNWIRKPYNHSSLLQHLLLFIKFCYHILMFMSKPELRATP